jgi:ribosomal protein S18 acetylase RimI-like enzyme
MTLPAAAWRTLDQADEPALRALVAPLEIHATALSDKLRTPEPFRNDRDRILVHSAGIDGFDAVLYLSASGCAMPIADSRLGLDRVTMLMEDLRKHPLVPGFKPASCVGLETTTRSLQQALGWKPALSVHYDAMSLDALDFTPRNADRPSSGEARVSQNLPAVRTRSAVPDDLESLLPVARAYELEEVATAMHPFDEIVCRANQARSLARYRVRILELGGRVVARAQTNAVGYRREQLGGIIVLPELRGRGYGRRVVTELAALVLAEGKGLSLFVKKGNGPARRLYESLGFRFSGDFRVDYFK